MLQMQEGQWTDCAHSQSLMRISTIPSRILTFHDISRKHEDEKYINTFIKKKEVSFSLHVVFRFMQSSDQAY